MVSINPISTAVPLVRLGSGLRQRAANIEKAQALIENLGANEFGKFLSDEEKKWSEVARAAKIAQ